jgi:hypothetical protein
MLKGCFDVKITITMICIIVLYPLLPTLAHGQQSVFAYQTIIKNKLIIDRIILLAISFSAYTRRGQNNSNPNNISSTHKVVILNFYDDDKSQITNAKPILDKYGFKATL